MWSVQKWDGAAWVDDYFDPLTKLRKVYLPNPGNREIGLEVASNASVVTLYDGSQAVVTPKVKYRREAFDFEITEYQLQTYSAEAQLRTSDFLGKLDEYVREKTGLLLTSHTDEKFEGFFLSARKVYLLSGKEQRYTLVLRFQPFDVNGDGVLGT